MKNLWACRAVLNLECHKTKQWLPDAPSVRFLYLYCGECCDLTSPCIEFRAVGSRQGPKSIRGINRISNWCGRNPNPKTPWGPLPLPSPRLSKANATSTERGIVHCSASSSFALGSIPTRATGKLGLQSQTRSAACGQDPVHSIQHMQTSNSKITQIPAHKLLP